jgi:hypothetical protein
LWTTVFKAPADVTLDGMTIASHCVALIREHGPLTPDELGDACREAGVTTSRQPANAVKSALHWYQDGRVLLVRDRFHDVVELLDGRWLTFPRADESLEVRPDIDLACLARLVQRDGLPLADGGVVASRHYVDDAWVGPDGWLPDGDVLGLQLSDGTARVAAVVIDDAARERGARLAEQLTEGASQRSFGFLDRRRAATAGLLRLLAADDELLREPVPPLSTLLPGADYEGLNPCAS